MKIGIIGQGVLGKTHKNYLLKNTEHEVMTYDINWDCNSTIEIIASQCEIIFIYVPTDTGKDGRLDMSIVESVVKELDGESFKGSCVIRSTLRVGTTQRLQAMYPDIDFYFMPEFLTERFAEEEFKNPHRKLILGYTKEFKRGVWFLSLISHNKIVNGLGSVAPAKDVEMVKIATNSFYAMKVIFANELHSICDKYNLNYNIVKTDLVGDPRIGSVENDLSGRDVHFRIGQDGKLGYGGKCLPKDTMEFVEMAKEKGIKNGLIEKVVSINKKIRK